MQLQGVVSQPDRGEGRQARARPWGWLEGVVYLLVALLISVRFFTERVPVLPRALNAIDLVMVPLLLPLCLAWVLLRGRGRLRGAVVAILGGLFVGVWALSWLANLREVHWLGALLFAFGLLTPVLFFLILTNIGLGRRFCDRMGRLLMALLGANLLIGTAQAAQGLGDPGNHDFVFGTFGLNQNQLAFFLAVMIAYLLARWRHLGLSPLEIGALLWAGVLFLLCSFQTLWVIFAVACALVFLPLREILRQIVQARLSRRLLLMLAGLVLTATLTLTTLSFGRFSVGAVLNELVVNFDRLGKVQLVRSVPAIWAERPMAIVLGTGPGTFNSRAFRSIAVMPSAGGASDVAGAIVAPFYRSELADRYILPYFTRGVFFLSGSNTDGPFTSYVSIPVEAGLLGAAAIFGIYAMAAQGLRRSRLHSDDPQERALAAWAATGLYMLLGIAAVDNYLEATRYTLLVWLAVAVWAVYRQRGGATKEQRP